MIKTDQYLMETDWSKNPFPTEQNMEYGVFVLCTQGSISVTINSCRYDLTKGNIVICAMFASFKISDISEDFDGYLVGFCDDFFKRLKLPNSIEYLAISNSTPLLELNEVDYNRMTLMLDQLDLVGAEDNEFVQAMNNALFLVVAYNIIYSYLATTHKRGGYKTHNEVIFRNFMLHMYGNCKFERSVTYYADRQHITPRHLNRLVKDASGKSPSDWIAQTTIDQLKMSVKYENMSINDLAVEFNFSQPSVLHTYFKKHTGMTLSEYRDSVTE